MTPDVSIIIVSYNAPGLLAACLRSLAAHPQSVGCEVIVVDNASTDRNVSMLEQEFSEAVLVKNARNRGFAAACNQGIALARGAYILLLNPDTELRDDAIGRTVEFIRSRSGAGVAACRLRYADGRPQQSVGTFPSVLDEFLQALFLVYLLPGDVLVGPGGFVRVRNDAPIQVDWMTGAFLLFKREVVEAIGLLDEQFFLYSEEMDFCRRAVNAGIGVWFDPRSSIVHHWGGMSTVSRRGLLWLLVSQMLFLRKHYRGVRLALLVALKYFGLCIRIPVYLAAGILMLDRERLRKAWYVTYVVYRLWTTPLKYNREPGAPATHWPSIW